MSTIYAMPPVLSLMGHAWSKQGETSLISTKGNP
jgi:hypothetical protein